MVYPKGQMQSVVIFNSLNCFQQAYLYVALPLARFQQNIPKFIIRENRAGGRGNEQFSNLCNLREMWGGL